jgi:adenine-specific DNA-methyltransferase
MERMRMETKDLTQENIKKLAELFPNVVTEMKDENGNLKMGINFELLKQELSGDVVDGEECYDFTWVGKRAAMVEANTPIRKTLRPCVEESKNWETTENIYIEGDNLDALKLLQESYLNSVKLIYIDPPYNTGNDSFVYSDDYRMDQEEVDHAMEYRDEEGNINFRKNTDTNPRFHSDWCSMMYPRLKLARNLLSEDGVMFISIDDNEVHTLKQMCNDVFGESNFVACVIWERAFAPVNLKKHFSESHDYVLCYAKNIDVVTCNGLLRSDLSDSRYSNPDNDPRGPWTSSDLSVGPVVPEKVYKITSPSGREIYPPEGRCWVYTKERFDEMLRDKRIWFGETGDGVPRLKRFLADVKSGITPMTVWKHSEVGHSQGAKQKLKRLFDGLALFDYPKSVDLIKRMLDLYSTSDSTIMDFFAGSSTTAHAVMQLNAEDGGNRKFIMVQLPEPTDEKSAAYKAGYQTISDIGKERIRRAGEKIKAEIEEANAKLKDGEEPKKVPDIGFRVFKVDSTNMKDVYYAANEITQEQLFDLESNIKEDRTDLDLLYGVMVDWGLPLSLNHETETIEGVDVHTVDHGSLVACFAENVPETVVREIAKRQPLRVVFRDSSFSSSPEKINVVEIFKLLSPNTSVKVI